jgi:hypothetical protein
VDGLKSLGLAGVTTAQVREALKELKVSDMDGGEVLKAVFLYLKRQDTSPPVPKPKPKPSQED